MSARTASAGVSYNKFIAKLASDQNKPDGLCVIPPAKGEAFVATLPVSRFHGIGPKTASKLIQEYGDVEAVLAAAPEMKPSKMRDNLIEHADKARLSRQLVELICDSPLPEPLEELAMKGIPEEPLREFLDFHGFRSLLARLGVQSQAASAPTPWASSSSITPICA